jgi:hypothetical protein
MMLCQILFYRSRLFFAEAIPDDVARLIADPDNTGEQG